MRLSTRVLTVVVPTALFLSMAPQAWAARNPAPRIVAAKMVDSDRDDRADRVLLTYSEPVSHASDADGRYPFAVSGYAIRLVAGAARSRYVTLVLTERSARDIAARPLVRYTTTRKKPVKDRHRKQALAQGFSGIVALDLDRDGHAAKDCRPTQAWVHPGAADRPDTGLVDANCDGIDGLRTGPVFTSSLGSDTNSGTITAPVRTFARAVTVSGGTRDIYLATGSYPSGVTSSVTSSVFGGYANTWSRRATNISTISVSAPLQLGGSPTLQLLRVTASSATTPQGPVAVTVENASARFELVAITAGASAGGSASTAAQSSVGLLARNATVRAIGGSISAGTGGLGAAGMPGAAGATGSNGADGSPGECVVGIAAAPGGVGGLSPTLDGSGGAGGLGGTIVVPGTAGTPSAGLTAGGAGGATGTTGQPGQPGTPGADGLPGVGGTVGTGVFSASGYVPGTSTDGSTGTAGLGGGGGGGGGAQLDLLLLGTGNGGGGGGGAGAVGTGGTAASGGGGSMAVWADTSSIVLSGTRIVTLGGGNGGVGGAGGTGGNGGDEGQGAAACAGRVGGGGDGGVGGAAGSGGDGGDGSGGPSIGVVRRGGSTVTTTGVVWQLGPGGTSPAGVAHIGPRFTVGTVS